LLSHKLEIFQRKRDLPWAYDDIAVNIAVNQHSKSSQTGLSLEPELFEQLATVLITTPRRHRKLWRLWFNNFFLGCLESWLSAILAVESQASKSLWASYINKILLRRQIVTPATHIEMGNNVDFHFWPTLYRIYRIYQLSPKSAEKGQKRVMQKRHKRVADVFSIHVTPIKIKNHEDFVFTTFF
jgi:hypothetical protein